MARWVCVEQDNYAYLVTGKTGCSSILQAIGSTLGVAEIGKNPHTWDWGHLARSLNDFTPPDGMYSFAFVRNPFDRLVSAWADKIKPLRENRPQNAKLYDVDLPGFPRGLTFEAFALSVMSQPPATVDHHVRPQNLILAPGGVLQITDVFRFETLAADFEKLQQKYGWEPLPHENRSEHAGYREYYSAALRDKAIHYYKSDMDMFSYAF